MQTPCTLVNKKILNISRIHILRKCFYRFSIKLCASNLDAFKQKYIFQIQQKIYHKAWSGNYQSDKSSKFFINLDYNLSLH